MENENNTNNTNSATQTVDYEAEYKKAVAERDSFRAEVEKQKQLKDRYASENAEYKRKAESQLTEDEKKAKELQDLLADKERMESELTQMRLERELLASGFTSEESDKLIKGKFAVKDIADIVKARVDEAVKSARAEFTKNTTSTAPVGGAKDGKSDFQKRQDERKQNTNIVEL